MKNPYFHYQKVATETADPLELVIMLYRGAISFLADAEQAIRHSDIGHAHARLIRTQEIIAELMGTLNLDAGEIAQNLNQLYDYAQRRLLLANLRKDIPIIIEVRTMLSELLETWIELSQRRHSAILHGEPALAGHA